MADERNMLLILDQAQTAFGRLGETFSAVYHGVLPDLMTTSRNIGGGLPLGATIASDAI